LSLVLGTSSDNGDNKSKDEVERVSDRVQAVVAYYPPVDLREWVGKLTDKFPALGFDPKDAESVSPLLHVSADDPPTLLIHGDKDDLVKLDNGEQGDRAAKSLIDWFDKYLAAPTNGSNGKEASEKAAASP
jgi:BD-FAE protein